MVLNLILSQHSGDLLGQRQHAAGRMHAQQVMAWKAMAALLEVGCSWNCKGCEVQHMQRSK